MTIVLTVVALALVALFVWRRTVRVPCEIDLEATHDHFHAHVFLEGAAPDAGDAVTVLSGAPTRIPFGEKRRITSHARISKASGLRRAWTRIAGAFQIHELYDVGFE